MNIPETIEDIKLTLGGTVLDLEITDTDIERIILKAYRVAKPYISEVKKITRQASRKMDLRNDKVLDVFRVIPTIPSIHGDEMLFDFQVYSSQKVLDIGMVQRSAMRDIYYPFDFQDGFLYLSEGYVMGMVTLECIVDLDISELKDERVVTWIESYATALCKETIGRIRSKFKSNNLPVELDGETLLSEAQSEKTDLENSLKNEDFGFNLILR